MVLMCSGIMACDVILLRVRWRMSQKSIYVVTATKSITCDSGLSGLGNRLKTLASSRSSKVILVIAMLKRVVVLRRLIVLSVCVVFYSLTEPSCRLCNRTEPAGRRSSAAQTVKTRIRFHR